MRKTGWRMSQYRGNATIKSQWTGNTGNVSGRIRIHSARREIPCQHPENDMPATGIPARAFYTERHDHDREGEHGYGKVDYRPNGGIRENRERRRQDGGCDEKEGQDSVYLAVHGYRSALPQSCCCTSFTGIPG
jgi:hypothetical protein